MAGLLIQQIYPNSEYVWMLELTFGRHARYCGVHGLDYRFQVSGADMELGGWEKLRLARAALEQYEQVIWLDADAVIMNLHKSLLDAPHPPDSIGACWFPSPKPHWNVGVLYFKAGVRMLSFLDEWLARYPGDTRWHEQEIFLELGLKSEVVTTLPDEWNSSLDHNYVPNPVVAAFHGIGARHLRMAEYLKKQT